MASEKMKKAIKLMVTTSMSQREIAKELNVAEQTVCNWKKEKDFDEIKLREEREFLGGITGLAIRTYKNILENGKSEHVRYLVAQDILDRTGHKPTDKQEISYDEPITIVWDIPNENENDK